MSKQIDPPADSKASDYEDQFNLNKAVAIKYHEHLIRILANPAHRVTTYLAQRGLSRAQIVHWQLGYAPTDWRFITEKLVEKGLFAEGVALSVCVEGDRNRDFFHDRLIIPIYNEQGRIVGFTGRSIGAPERDFPKYLNIKNTVLFQKSEVLYGIHKALRSMKLTKQAVLTEGNLDVTSLHLMGIDNAVAKGGTALTDEQVALLARHVELVVLISDTDPAGQKAARADLEKLLLAGLRVKLFHLAGAWRDPDKAVALVPGFKDADDWVQYVRQQVGRPIDSLDHKQLEKLGAAEYLGREAQDGLLLLADELTDRTRSMDELYAGARKLEEFLAAMRDGRWMQQYIDLLGKPPYKFDKKHLVKNIESLKAPGKSEASDDEVEALPEWVDRKMLFAWGFVPRLVPGNPSLTGYYFANGSGGMETKPVTNFVLHALYLVKDRGNVRRLVVMDNGLRQVVIEINAKALNAVQPFEELVSSEGFFYTSASYKREHLKRIGSYIMAETPEAFPIKTLGWQPEGFWAYSNAVYNGKLENYNEYGVVKVHEKYYYSPSISAIFDNYRLESDDYKSDKYLSYAPSPVSFGQWMRQMMNVYGDRAMVGAVFGLTSLFKDVVRKSSKIPILYCYGPKDSGKSTFAESILYLFFGGRDTDGELIKPLNLGSMPTGPAFWATMARFRNCPMLFNEFDDNRVADQFFTAFKSAWDGEGRVRGTVDKSKTEEQSVNCTIMLVGQYLSTKDDGSVTSRSLTFEFMSRKDNAYTAVETKAYDQLRDLQKSNISGIIPDLLRHRPLMEQHYQTAVRAIKAELADAFVDSGEKYASRTFENVTCLLATYEVLKDVIDWPFTKEEFWSYCRTLIVQMSAMMTESDALSKFWSMLEYLLDRGEVIEGWDFKVETAVQVKLRTTGSEQRLHTFAAPTRLLYVRVGNVHKPYAENYRRQTGDRAMDEQTLRVYMKQQGYFVGETAGTYFKRGGKSTSTNALIFNYDYLSDRSGISLERTGEDDDVPARVTMTYSGVILKEPKTLPVG